VGVASPGALSICISAEARRLASRALGCVTMAEIVKLGEVTCPSGQLVLMDGGYLGLWTGERSPEDARRPDEVPAVDYEVGDLTECDALALPSGTFCMKACPAMITCAVRSVRRPRIGLSLCLSRL
jgi:hypothetical protein